MTAWLLLFLAGGCEVVGVHGFQYLARRRYTLGTILTAAGFIAALACLHFAMTTIAPPVAYALFTGIGTLGGVLVGRVVFDERLSPGGRFCLGIVLVALVGLRLTATGTP